MDTCQSLWKSRGNSSNLQSVLFKKPRRVHLSSLNIGICRKPLSKPKLEIGFKFSWKFSLKLCK